MDNIERLVRERRSFRTFDGREVTTEDREKLCRFMETIDNPFLIGGDVSRALSIHFSHPTISS